MTIIDKMLILIQYFSNFLWSWVSVLGSHVCYCVIIKRTPKPEFPIIISLYFSMINRSSLETRTVGLDLILKIYCVKLMLFKPNFEKNIGWNSQIFLAVANFISTRMKRANNCLQNLTKFAQVTDVIVALFRNFQVISLIAKIKIKEHFFLELLPNI